MVNPSCAVLALASTLLLPTLAGAFTVADGKYDGTSDDGQGVELVVGTNPDTGNQGIIGATVSFSAACRGLGTGITLTTGFGLGPNSDLIGNKALFDTTNSYFDIKVAATFKSDGTVTGELDSRTPTLVPNAYGRPNRAAFCESSWQHFSLSYAGSADRVPPAAGIVLLTAKPR